ncbi:kinase-like protein [Amniculicola lignicola CBS 123094]|uniref:Aurora kinase n=1 Tax=Amniculicola lignicola CBS 123094 TaxID=1392246 RepID=A0A6A5WTQ8_9PLEO|nr:kinase-like protein [Amniculicola lignicola CBS 123094]
MAPRNHTEAGQSSGPHRVLVENIRTEVKTIRAKVNRAKARLSALAVQGRTRVTKAAIMDTRPVRTQDRLKQAVTTLSKDERGPPSAVRVSGDHIAAYEDKGEEGENSNILAGGSTQRITDFELGGALGRGKFGTVYLARHCSSNYVCAIKILSKAQITNDEEEKFIRRELEVHQNLAHPNILRFLSWFHDDAQIYLVLEYAAGGNLLHNLRKQRYGRFTEDQVAHYIEQVADALKYMHDKNIMHRDIKPENILLGLHGEIKLADFGYSIHSVSGLRSTVCGTLDYIPPEIAKMTGSPTVEDLISQPYNVAKYTKTVDQWSLGILTYELLVGRPPFEMRSRKATEKRIAGFKGKVRFPAHVSQGATDFVMALLTVQEEERMGLDGVMAHEWLRRHCERE